MNVKKDFSPFYGLLRFADNESRQLLWHPRNPAQSCPVSVVSSKRATTEKTNAEGREVEREETTAASSSSTFAPLLHTDIQREKATLCWIGRDGTISGHCDLRVCGKAFIICSEFCENNELDRFLSTVKQFCDLANASLWSVYPTCFTMESIYNNVRLIEYKEIERFQAITDIVDTIDDPVADQSDTRRGKFDCALFHFLRDECQYPRRVIDTILGDRRLLRAASYVLYQNAVARDQTGEIENAEETEAIRSSIAERKFIDNVFELL